MVLSMSMNQEGGREAMMSWRRWSLVGVLTLCCLPGVVWAQSEVDILLDKLVEKGILTNVGAGLIRREIAETKETRNKQLAKEIVPDSARNWKWKGDIRLRDEIRNRQGTGADSHRTRIRFRYGVEGKVSDELKVAARLATGSTADPISTNDSFDDFFNKKPIILDLAYVEYAPPLPSLDSRVHLVGGIMENPMWTVTPMVWDGDLGWDGFALKASQKLSDSATLFSNNGVFLLDTDESEPASLWVTQGGATLTPWASAEGEFLKNFKLTSALAYHDYRNTANSSKAGTDPLTREADNTSAAKDFNQLNPSLELASQVSGMPVAIFGDWVRNLSASSTGNDGFALGVKVSKAKNPFFSLSSGLNLRDGWEAGYMFERLERDATFDEFADSDFGGGGTNRRGNVAYLTFATLKNSTFGCKYFFSQDTLENFGSGATLTQKFSEDRIQLDWVTKFQ